MPLLDPEVSRKLGKLQLLDDAIAYRLSRLDLPCPCCGPAGRCDEHGRDEELVTGYVDRYAAVFSDVLAGIDPGEVALMMRPGDSTPPTVGAVGAALMSRLRALAATGPVILELEGGPVLIEQDGPVLVEHPLTIG